MIIYAPAPVTDNKYSRAECLFLIIQSAAFQMHQDALGVEQEDVALTSRLNSINMLVEEIRANDPLLK
jgi:hypothetical protein